MSYIGNEPIVSATRTITEITATAGQTVFVANGGYTVGFIDVFVNGAQLQTSDFTATNGSSITLNSPATIGDDIRLVAWGKITLANALPSVAPVYTGGLTGDTGVVNIGSGQLYKDTSGNVGIGVTPGIWSSGKAIEIGSQGNAIWGYTVADIYFTSNLNYNSGWKYASNNAAGAGIYEINGGSFYWYRAASGTAGNTVSPSLSMMLDASGNLLVGTSTLAGTEKFNTTNAAGPAFRFNGSTAAGSFTGDDLNHYMVTFNSKAGGAVTHYQVGFYNSSGTNVGAITHNFSNTTYSTSSDYRLKENITPMTGALDKVALLKPCTYVWKSTGEASQGFIAHELQEVCPEAVIGEKDAVNEDGSIKPQGIDTSFLVATLTAAIQELKAEFDAYKATHP